MHRYAYGAPASENLLIETTLTHLTERSFDISDFIPIRIIVIRDVISRSDFQLFLISDFARSVMTRYPYEARSSNGTRLAFRYDPITLRGSEL